MIEPLNENYLIQIERSDVEKSLEKHGVKVDNASKRNNNVGKVIQVHHHDGAALLNVGDTVVFKPYGNEEVTYEGEDYLLVPQENVVGRIVKE